MEAMKYHLLPERRPMFQSPRTKPRKSTVGALYAVGGMDATKGRVHIAAGDLNTVYQHSYCYSYVRLCVCRLHHHREVWSANQYMGPSWGHEWTAAAVWCGCDWQQVVCGWGQGWTEDIQHGGVLQPHQQGVVHHATHVNTQTRTWWVGLMRQISELKKCKLLCYWQCYHGEQSFSEESNGGHADMNNPVQSYKWELQIFSSTKGKFERKERSSHYHDGLGLSCSFCLALHCKKKNPKKINWQPRHPKKCFKTHYV